MNEPKKENERKRTSKKKITNYKKYKQKMPNFSNFIVRNIPTFFLIFNPEKTFPKAHWPI
jgi:hypothetical protein